MVGANHDKRTFAQPDAVDIVRDAAKHLVLSHGKHTWLGAHLMRLNNNVVIDWLLARHPDYSVDERGVEVLIRGMGVANNV